MAVVPEDTIATSSLTICDDAWIGANVIVTPSCHCIGMGAVVGAGAVVTKDVPDFAVVAGNPARVIKMRFDELTCDIVRQSQWWTKTIEEISPYVAWMTSPLSDVIDRHPLLAAAQVMRDAPQHAFA